MNRTVSILPLYVQPEPITETAVYVAAALLLVVWERVMRRYIAKEVMTSLRPFWPILVAICVAYIATFRWMRPMKESVQDSFVLLFGFLPVTLLHIYRRSPWRCIATHAGMALYLSMSFYDSHFKPRDGGRHRPSFLRKMLHVGYCCSYLLPPIHAKIAMRYRGMFFPFGHLVALFYVIYFGLIVYLGMVCFTKIAGEQQKRTPHIIDMARLVIFVDGAWNSFS